MFYSGLLDELLPALGAGDGDLTLAPGDPDGLTALGTGVVAVVPVLQPVQHQQEAAVFIVALVGAAGKAAVQGQDQQDIAEHRRHQDHQLAPCEHADDRQDHAHDQQCHIEPVMAVAPHHEALDTVCKIHSGLTQPAAYISHWDHLDCKDYMLIIRRDFPIATAFMESSQKLRIPVTEILKSS